MRRFAILPAFALALIAAAAVAQEEPPARVGRISFVSGQLAFHMFGETSWSAAAVNYPVATGGSFWTDPQSRAEIRIGSQTIDLAGNTEVDIIRLDEQVVQIAVPEGRADLHLRTLDQGNSVEIDIPRGGVWLLETGVYDIDAGAPDRAARVAVFDGSAHFVGGGVDLAIEAGKVAVLTGDNPVAATTERAAPDAFVQWCRSRDYQPQRLAAPYYLSPRMTGYEELDEYGAWRAVADYGEVWFPSAVPADWAPYREGHWVWVEPWGWNWVDAEPWGFGPFHYGRWARIENRWAWVPGHFEPQPVYAPALVAFIGNPGVGAARGSPSVGWFPLGPGEVYWPSYTRDPGYVRRLNVGNVGDSKIVSIANAITKERGADPPQELLKQDFVNRTAATMVPVRVFANAARVAPAALRVPPQSLQQMPISLRPPPITPSTAHPAPGGRPTVAAPAAAAPGRPPGHAASTGGAAVPAAAHLRSTERVAPVIAHFPPSAPAPARIEHGPPAQAMHASPPQRHAAAPLPGPRPAAAAPPTVLHGTPRPAGPSTAPHPIAGPAPQPHPAARAPQATPIAAMPPHGGPAPRTGGKPAPHGGNPPAEQERR